MKIPDNYLPVMPYLLIKDAYRFLAFAKDIFDATQQYLAPRSEGVIKHAEIRIGDAVIMFADATDTYPVRPAGMFLYVPDADKIHQRVVAAGFELLNPLENRDYGRGFGFEDGFGNQWWVNTPL
ncbi:MAG: VOC family protein [Chitinophaga rupis]